MTDSRVHATINLVKELERLAKLFSRHQKMEEAEHTKIVITELEKGKPEAT